MRRKLKNLKNKGGASENGAPRQLLDETVYREHWNFINATIGSPHWDPQYSGWSNASRDKDHAIFLRATIPVGGPIAPSVDLGTAGDFAILAETTITNASTSVVLGDMGLSPAAASAPNTGITGFSTTLSGSGQFLTSAQVVGDLYAANLAAPTPAKMTLAISDMLAAYTFAQDQAATHPTTSPILGGQTLTPGVWHWAVPVTIDTPLTFNGAGVYILRMDSTMEMGASGATNFVLTGGATIANIFFAVAGAVTIHAGSTFEGELLGGTSIAVQTGANVNGRLLAQSQVTLDGNHVTMT